MGERPPSGGGEKSLLEILVIPIALTLVTALVGYFADRINHRAQEAANERALQAAQIAAVAEISAGSAKPLGAEGKSEKQSIPLFVARLALYEERAVPILLALLQDEESDQRLTPQERTVVERNLIQIALREHADAVGRPLLEVLDDPFKLYGSGAHGSALRILSRICYSGFAEVLARYAPQNTMKEGDWSQLSAQSVDIKTFERALALARERALDPKCGAKPKIEPSWASLRWYL